MHGKKIILEGVRFGYGADVIADALTVRERWGLNNRQKPKKKTSRGSIAVRIKRDGVDDWRLIVQVSRYNDLTCGRGGMIGVDFNDGFLAVACIGVDGNCARRDLDRFDIGSYGGTMNSAAMQWRRPRSRSFAWQWPPADR